jgi:hypothetical protein
MAPTRDAFFEQRLDDAVQLVARRADRLTLWVGAPLVLTAISAGVGVFASVVVPGLQRLGLEGVKTLAFTLVGCAVPLMVGAVALGR